MHVRGLKAELFTCDVASKLANAFLGCEEVELQKEKGAPNLEEESDPKKACVYNLWIKAPLEKSWIMFRLNDELADYQPRRIIEIEGTPITQTEETMGLADDKDTRLVHTLPYSGGAITMGGTEELLELGMEEDTHKKGKKEMRFSLLKWNT
ncbi:hypothetical protein LIER_30658 [Lithospermum erythrorhizon]|uniref:Uncharacterized protein n=1 Tax=Lithospermum erythrorhizon TaxID=34254 RepID=A0AAV3RNE3_LITER